MAKKSVKALPGGLNQGRGGHYWPNLWTPANRMAHVLASAGSDLVYNAIIGAGWALGAVTVLRAMGVALPG